MDGQEFSHRNLKTRLVRIDVKKRDSKAHAIISCDKDDLAKKVKDYQDLNYEVVNIREM